jgi:hypothetical protein
MLVGLVSRSVDVASIVDYNVGITVDVLVPSSRTFLGTQN